MFNKIVLLSLLLLTSAGCFNAKTAVAERAANEFQCPVAQVNVEELGANGYRAWACGTRTIYVCSQHLQLCFKEGGSVRAARGQGQGVVARPAATGFGGATRMPAMPGTAPTSTVPTTPGAQPWPGPSYPRAR